MKYFVSIAGRVHEVEIVERLGELIVSVGGQRLDVSYEEVDTLGQVILLHGGESYAISIEGDEARIGVTLAGYHYATEIEDERERAAHIAERAASRGGGVVKSVMPGVVVEILVAPGDEVEAGQPLLILEAMKMQNEISAPGGGRVKTIHVEAGSAVAGGANLVTLQGRE